MWMGTGPKLGELQNPTSGFSEDGIIQSAEPVNIRLRGVNVAAGHDLTGSLDLVIATKFQFANQPEVTRLHYLQQDTTPDWYTGALYQNIVLTTRDFSHDDLTLSLHVYDRDNLEEEKVDTAAGLAATIGVAVGFPGLASLAKAADSVSGMLTDIVNLANKNEDVLQDQIRLEPDEEPNQGTDLLQPGYLVAIESDQIEASGYRLNQDTKLVTGDGEEVDDISYAVFEVEREHNEVDFSEKDQKAAKLAAELNGKGQSNKDPLHYFRETLDAYDKFDRVQRAEQLND